MTAEDLNSAKDHLERARKEMLWLLDVLDNPTTRMQEYNLTRDEQEELFLESQRKLADIHMALARLYTKEVSIQVGDKTVRLIGIQPWPDMAWPEIPPWPKKPPDEQE